MGVPGAQSPKNNDKSEVQAMEELLQSQPPMRVILLGLDQGLFDAQRSMDELSALCEAGGREAVA